MEKTTYFNFDTQEGLAAYQRKAQSNLAFLRTFFNPLERNPSLQRTEGENRKLVERIHQLTGISEDEIEAVNCGDEFLRNAPANLAFGCTAIARNKNPNNRGIFNVCDTPPTVEIGGSHPFVTNDEVSQTNGSIGQNLDLFAVDLAVIREGDTLYLTMPPYLALFGMNEHLAFCTNYLSSPVSSGVSVAQMRRNLLRCNSLDAAVEYLRSIPRATAANFLINDGEEVRDIEISSEAVKVHQQLTDSYGFYFAHTNHFLSKDIREDNSCARLSGAVQGLQEGKELEDILLSRGVYVPVESFGPLSFGSLITVVMDVKKGTFRYRDCYMQEFEEVKLKT